MTPALAQVTEDAATASFTLLRASPRGEGRLLLALRTSDEVEVAGQWFADPERCRDAAVRTARVARPGSVSTHADRLLVQRDGADRRLPGLQPLVDAGGELVAHRPERRGVVRHDGGGRYTKVVAAGRVEALAATLRHAAGWTGVTVPPVLEVDAEHGRVALGSLPGATLHDLLHRHAEVVRAGELVGAALARLHAEPAPPGAAAHTVVDELEVTRRWLVLAADQATLPLDLESCLRRTVSRVAEHRTGRVGVLHRDLHDKQLLLDGDDVGMLDLDLLAVGEPALDLANLLVHLELRTRQGLLPGVAARAVADAVLRGYAPDPGTRAALPLYARLTRLRLAGVYAFRPAQATAALRLPLDPLLDELD